MMDLRETLLAEQPWVQLTDLLNDESDDGIIWDFCSEERGWLWQLRDLFTKGRMRTMTVGKNAEDVIEFDAAELPSVVRAMLDDPWFRAKFREDFSKLSDEEQLEFKDVLPAEFMELI